MSQCPSGNAYCYGVACNHWALMGWCLLSSESRAVHNENEDLKLKIILLEVELKSARRTMAKTIEILETLNRKMENLKGDSK